MSKYYGKPLPPMTVEDERRFWGKVNVPSNVTKDCWLWTAGKFTQGYGQFYMRHNGKDTTTKAHRVSYTLINGPIPDTLDLLHSCDVMPCVSPYHLRRGRHQHGETHGRAKLDEKDVGEIKRLYGFKGVNGLSSISLARRYGVSKPIILGIINGVGWTHLL